MLRGIYTAATGMLQQQKKLDTISNNMANVSTPGYKRDDVVARSFKDELLLRTDAGGTREIGAINHGVQVERVATFFKDGVIEKSDVPTHMAIQGEGFFTVLTEQGERYTRDGSFHINENGELVTLEGFSVVGQDGQPIIIENQEFEVDRHGNIIIEGNIVNQLQLANFQDIHSLHKVGNNLFENIDPDNENIDFAGEIFQGYTETSNVDPLREIENMTIAARSYESSQKILQMMDESLGKAVNEVGKV